MKKLVIVSYNFYPPNYSGQLIISYNRLKEIASEKLQVVVFTSGVKNYKSNEITKNFNVYRSPYIGDGKITSRFSILVYWIWVILKIIFEKGISLNHFIEPKGISIPFYPIAYETGWIHFGLLAKISRKRKIKTIFEHAISDPEGHFAPDKWQKYFYNNVDSIVCVSDGLYEGVYQVYPQKAEKIVNAVEDDLFLPLEVREKKIIRKDERISDQAIVFCFMGLVVYRKGFDLICEVFPDIVKEFPESVLWCIGPNNERESVHVHDGEVAKYKAALDPVRDRVKFWGKIVDRHYLAKIIGAADIFLFPTRREGFGLAPVEAMSCGVPPIISLIPGVTDMANIEGETGLYISPGDPNELKHAMRKLAADKKMREKMGQNARIRVEQAFSWRKHVDQWDYFYNHECFNQSSLQKNV